ncbi:hypothetical protein PMAYCL1PPCAC_04585, partial [Pristionchus mayeri]
IAAFDFEKDQIRMYRSWKIGNGETVPHKNLVPNGAKLNVLKSRPVTDEDYWVKLGDPHYTEKKEEADDEEDEDSQCASKLDKKCVKKPRLESTLYRCPIESCSKEFLSEKNPVIDDAMESILKEDGKEGEGLPMGWALHQRRKSERFPDHVKAWLKLIYDKGEETGSKTDPRQAAEQIAGVYSGFKKTKLEKRARTHAGGTRNRRAGEKEPDELNDLFDIEGDPELEYKTDPLFDERDYMWIALMKDEEFLRDLEEEK